MLRSAPTAPPARPASRRVSPPGRKTNVRAPTRAASAHTASADMGSTTRSVWEVKKTGSLSGMVRVDDARIDPPGPGEVRVKVRAIGLNFADVFSVLGLYGATPDCPFVPGLECCGVVEAIGPPDENLPEGTVVPPVAVGDSVMVVTRFGAYASAVNAPLHQCRPLPTGWTHEQGAAFLVQGLTAFYALKKLGDVRRGHTVLVHSAAGGCGLFGIGICNALGAVPIATVGSPTKVSAILERFPDMDPETIIVRERKRFGDQVEAAATAAGSTDGTCDVVMDAVMGDFFKGGWSRLARGGRYVVYGAADLTPAGDLGWNVFGWLKLGWKYVNRPMVDPTNLPGDNKSVMGFNLIWMFDKIVELGELLGGLTSLGLPAPKVGEVFTFDKLPSAIRVFQSGGTSGKVVVTLDAEDDYLSA